MGYGMYFGQRSKIFRSEEEIQMNFGKIISFSSFVLFLQNKFIFCVVEKEIKHTLPNMI